MTSPRQEPSAPFAVVVSGAAGTGKSTLGRALARTLGAVPLDLDSISNPLLDQLDGVLPGPHWLTGPHARRVREGRYAALRTVARDVLAAGLPAVLIAPFTAEMHGGPAWDELVTALAPAPVSVVHLTGDPEVLAARRRTRGEDRDTFRSDDPARPPAVEHLSLSVLLSTAQQELRVLHRLGVRTPLPDDHPIFGRTFDAVLFDFDGTLADSTPAILRSWARLAAEYDFPAAAVQQNHGRPARALLSDLLAADRVDSAVARVEEFERSDVADVHLLPGALDLMSSLPPQRAAIVTSASRAVVTARLGATDLPSPGVLVALDDVERSKPHPEPFLTAAAELGVDPRRCLVFEDAVSGITAAHRAGCAVVAVAGTTTVSELSAADLVVVSLDRVRLVHDAGGIRLAP